ncbi:LINE-1 retrotransposable element ORF2 protein [Bienertia sinuspersici]
MSNECWLEAYPKANALFLPEAISAHSPAILRVDNCIGGGHKPFKYFRMWSSARDFNDRIAAAWVCESTGTSMYCLIKKLKQVKGTLIELNKGGFCEIEAEVNKALQSLNEAQNKLQQCPLKKDLNTVEKEAAQDYLRKNKLYMQFLGQKAKCNWIKEGDENTALFHRSIKQRRLQNNIYAIKNGNGDLVDTPEQVVAAFLEYYQTLLGQQQQQRQECNLDINQSRPTLEEEQKEHLIRPFTKKEVKQAMFSIKGDKAPGPDGFGSYFYQDNWNLIGEDICKIIWTSLKMGNFWRR